MHYWLILRFCDWSWTLNWSLNNYFIFVSCLLKKEKKESLSSLVAVSVCPDVLFMLILAQISSWMMINVVAILAYLIIHINILIFAVGSQIFIELSPILSPQHTRSLTLCVAKVRTTQNRKQCPFLLSIFSQFALLYKYVCMTPTGAQEIASFESLQFTFLSLLSLLDIILKSYSSSVYTSLKYFVSLKEFLVYMGHPSYSAVRTVHWWRWWSVWTYPDTRH